MEYYSTSTSVLSASSDTVAMTNPVMTAAMTNPVIPAATTKTTPVIPAAASGATSDPSVCVSNVPSDPPRAELIAGTDLDLAAGKRKDSPVGIVISDTPAENNNSANSNRFAVLSDKGKSAAVWDPWAGHKDGETASSDSEDDTSRAFSIPTQPLEEPRFSKHIKDKRVARGAGRPLRAGRGRGRGLSGTSQGTDMEGRFLSPSSSRSRHHSNQLPSKEVKIRPCWADLPGDLLSIIAENATTTNTQYVHLRAVCKAWQRALTPHPNHLPPQLPWFMLPQLPKNTHQILGVSDAHVSFYDIAQSKTYRLQLPYMSGKHCRGSSHGWLVLEHEQRVSLFKPNERRVLLFNPVTSGCINLPSLDAPPNFGYKHCIRKASLSCTPSKPGCVVVAWFLSSAANWDLGFCRIGDSQWTELKKWDAGPCLVNFTFYNNLVYTVNIKWEVSVYDLKDHSVWTFSSKINFIRSCDRIILVEGDADSSGPLIVRIFEYCGKTTVHAYKWCDIRKVWRRVRNIGKRVLFLNERGSVNVQCDEKQENGVYYDAMQPLANQTFGVGIHRGNLENGEEVPYTPSQMDVFPGYGSPMWVTPSLI